MGYQPLMVYFGVQLLILTVLLFVTRHSEQYFVKLYFLVFFLEDFIRFSGIDFGLPMNIEGKIIAALVSLLVIYYLVHVAKMVTYEDLNLTLGTYKGAGRIIIIASSVLVTMLFLSFFVFKGSTFSWGELLFQAIAPGIDEELLYRAIGIGMLSKVFTDKKEVLGVSVGWGFWIVALQFGLVHGVFFFFMTDSVLMTLINFTMTGLIGVLFGLVAVKTKSVVLPIVIHNGYNSLLVLLALFY